MKNVKHVTDRALAEIILGRGRYSPAARAAARDEWLRRRPRRPRCFLVKSWGWAADCVARGAATPIAGQACDRPLAS